MDKGKDDTQHAVKQFVIKYGAVIIAGARLVYEIAANLLGEHHH